MTPRTEALRVAGMALAAVGVICVVAGGYEAVSNRHLPHGWTRYQPGWAVPALVVGAVLMTLGLGLLLVCVLRQRRRP